MQLLESVQPVWGTLRHLAQSADGGVAGMTGAPAKRGQALVARRKADRPILKKTVRAPRAARLQKQQLILLEAERQFALSGFEGASLENIAAELGISRQNMLYYFASKDHLYGAVLQDILETWLTGMETMAKAHDPEVAISAYVLSKLRFSKTRPNGSIVFTREIMAGAPRYAATLRKLVVPHLRSQVRTFEEWARKGLIKHVDFIHLMFVIWSATQAYADLGPQFALLLGKRHLDDDDFATAHALITNLILQSLLKTPH